jgi:hypothetical protein
LAKINHCTLVLDFDWEDEEAVAAYKKLLGTPQLDIEDFEFMFRHAFPSPTFENMDACNCM